MSSDVAWTNQLAKVEDRISEDRKKMLGRFLALAEKWRIKAKEVDVQPAYMNSPPTKGYYFALQLWSDASELEALVKEMQK